MFFVYDTWLGELAGTLGTNIMFVLVTQQSLSARWACLGIINFEQLLNILSLVFKIQWMFCKIFFS